MKKFKQFLSERKQVGYLYHFTTLLNAIDILKENIIKGSFDGKKSFISFTRDKNFLKTADREKELGASSPLAISFKVDGNKLSDKYRIEPYNYSYENPGIEVSNESEERIAVGKGEGIKTFTNYIAGVILHKKRISKVHLLDVLLATLNSMSETKIMRHSKYSVENISDILNIPTKQWYDMYKKDFIRVGKTEEFKEKLTNLFISKFEEFLKEKNIKLEIKE